MNEAFKPEAQSKVYEVFCEFFVDIKRKENERIKEFIMRFDKLANVAKKHNMELPPTVLELKIIHDSGISNTDRKLVLTEINFDTLADAYKQANVGLNKYLDDTRAKEATSEMKLLDSGLRLERKKCY